MGGTAVRSDGCGTAQCQLQIGRFFRKDVGIMWIKQIDVSAQNVLCPLGLILHAALLTWWHRGGGDGRDLGNKCRVRAWVGTNIRLNIRSGLSWGWD